MVEFSSYYLRFLWSVWNNFINFFATIFGAFGKYFYTDIVNYFVDMGNATKDFNAFGWICLIIVTILNVVLIFFLIYRLVQVIRRWIVYRSREVEKDELVENIAKLKDQLNEMVKEKNRIFAMRFDGVAGLLNGKNKGGALPELTGGPTLATEVGGNKDNSSIKNKDDTKKLSNTGSRFSKLIAIDNKYYDEPCLTTMTSEDAVSLEQLVTRFVNFAASQLKLYYTPQTIRKFIAGMGTGKVLILEGISGTGKTSLPYAMGKFFKNPTNIVSVQPAWRDRADLLGYLNEFTKKFNETDFLKCIYEANYRDDLSFVILDEMNLARIEYYFAEFLSIMEMPDVSEWKIDLVPSPQENDPAKIVDGKVLVPQNIWFVGTANQDDSTFTITDKVYDRAITIDLSTRGKYFDAPLTEPINFSYDYLDSLYDKALKTYKISDTNMKNIMALDDFIMRKFKITFGNRILKQMNDFVPIFMACGGEEVEAIDFMLRSKVLRKFTSLNIAFLVKEINELITLLDKLFGKNKCPECINFLKDLLKNNI
jgi:hypothetical protein